MDETQQEHDQTYGEEEAKEIIMSKAKIYESGNIADSNG